MLKNKKQKSLNRIYKPDSSQKQATFTIKQTKQWNAEKVKLQFTECSDDLFDASDTNDYLLLISWLTSGAST